MKLNDVEIERNVIRCLIQIPNFSNSVFINGSVIETHFTDLFHQNAFTAIKKFYNKFGTTPSLEKLQVYIIPEIKYDERFKTIDNQKKIWLKSVERLYNKITESVSDNKDSDVAMLEHMRKVRLVQNLLYISEKNLNSGNLTSITDDMGFALNEMKVVETTMMEGNIVDDFRQHVNLIKQKKMKLVKPVPTGIFGVSYTKTEPNGKIVYLDDLLDGGLYPGEFYFIVGENNVGKSFLLMEIPVYASMLNRNNSILFTIEMNKIYQEMRIYSRISGIPFDRFRTGEITKDELIIVKNKLNWWEKNCGILHVVSFDTGATANDIEIKLKDAENKYRTKFDLVSIDYLNDMKPMGKFENSKSWDAMGEISWDLAQLSKRWNDRKGIPIITANQKKTTRAGTGNTDWQDAAFSPLPAQHASVGFGIGQGKDDEQYERIKFEIFKMRFGQKGMTFYTFPNFAKSRFCDKEKTDSNIENPAYEEPNGDED